MNLRRLDHTWSLQYKARIGGYNVRCKLNNVGVVNKVTVLLDFTGVGLDHIGVGLDEGSTWMLQLDPGPVDLTSLLPLSLLPPTLLTSSLLPPSLHHHRDSGHWAGCRDSYSETEHLFDTLGLFNNKNTLNFKNNFNQGIKNLSFSY